MKHLVLSLLLSLPLAAQQVHPPEYATRPGNDIAWVDGALRIVAGTIIENVPPQAVQGLSFRSAFREERPAHYGPREATKLDLSIRMSHGAMRCQTMGLGVDHHNATVQTVLPRTLLDIPSAPPAFPGGGQDALVPEPFLYRIALAQPFTVPTQSNLHFTLDLHGFYRGSWAHFDAFVVDYLPPQQAPAPAFEYGPTSVFWATVCGGHVPQLAETGIVWRGDRLRLEAQTRGESGLHALIVSSTLGGGAFPTVHGFCVTLVDPGTAVVLPLSYWSWNAWDLPWPYTGHLYSHRIVIDSGPQITVSGATRVHAAPVDWHSGRFPPVRTQYQGLGYHPGVWHGIVTEVR